jgi:O-antigen/teichoic acid export membrane protein
MRGASLLVGSRLLALLLGYVTYAVVSRTLTTSEFGVYGVVIAVATILNTVLGTGTTQTVSRLTARHPSAAGWVRDRMALVSLIGTLASGGMLAAAAAPLARLLNDPGIDRLLLVVALVPGLYAVFAVFTGSLNGRQEFGRQAAASLALAGARAAVVCGATLAGLGVVGALFGTLVAAALGAAAAWVLARVPASDERLPPGIGSLARMVTGFVGVSLLLQLLLSSDLLFLKRLLAPPEADHQAGLYTAAQSIARIPYFVLLAVSQAAYPRLSASVAARSADTARRTSTLVLSGLLVVLAGILAVSIPLSRQILLIVYPSPYSAAADVLAWLLAAGAALSVAEASLTMLTGATGPHRPALALTVAVLVQASAALVLIPRQGPVGAARSALVAGLVAAALALSQLRATAKTRLWLRLLASAAPACVVLALAARWFAGRAGARPLSTLVFLGAAYGSYLFAVALANRRALAAQLAR